MKKKNLSRILSLALAALMLLSMPMLVLTGCDDDEPETQTETETETETETSLAEAAPEAALSTVLKKLNDKTDAASKDFAKKAEEGKFAFGFNTNLKLEAKAVMAVKATMGGTTNTQETTVTMTVTVAEGGVALQLSVPEIAEISVVCTEQTVYVATTAAGEKTTEKITLKAEDQKKLADLLNGKLEDLEDEDLSEFQAIADAAAETFKNVGLKDVFKSITSRLDGDKLTISCKGIQAGLVTKLESLFEKVAALESETEAETFEFDFDIPEEDPMETIKEMLDAFKMDDVTFDLVVDKDGNLLAVSAKAGILQTQTEEGIGEMTTEMDFTVSVDVTRGGQKVEKPADADQYTEANDDSED